MTDQTAQHPAERTPNRIAFAFHWFAWKIGKALYPPRRADRRQGPSCLCCNSWLTEDHRCPSGQECCMRANAATEAQR